MRGHVARPWIVLTSMLILSACGRATASQPAASGQPSSPNNSTSVVEAAKSEGTVAVMGPVGTETQQALTEGFEAAYGIHVEFLGGSNRTIAPRVENEQAAGQYLWDVRVGGGILDGLVPINALGPIEPLLDPQVADGKNWRGGAIEYLGADREIIVMTPYQRGIIFVNPNLVNPQQFTSYKDLLDPKWKGQIVLDDPRPSGAGNGTLAFFYMHPDLGPDFIRAFAKQEPIILKDQRQEADYIAQGKAPILIGGSDATIEDLIRRGLPIAIVNPRQIKEGGDVSPANGDVAVFKNPPHPNATKLYVNWLLSKEGQTAFAMAQGYISSRLDVPTDFVEDWRVPAPGSIKTYDEQSLRIREDELAPLLTELLGN